MRPADRAWIILAGGILAYDLACPPGETLSEGMGRYHQARPWLTRTVVVYLAVHLLGWWPSRGDPLHVLTNLKRPQP